MKTAESIVNGTECSTTVKKMGLTVCIQILASPCIRHVVLGNLFNLLVPHILTHNWDDDNSMHLL